MRRFIENWIDRSYWFADQIRNDMTAINRDEEADTVWLSYIDDLAWGLNVTLEEMLDAMGLDPMAWMVEDEYLEGTGNDEIDYGNIDDMIEEE